MTSAVELIEGVIKALDSYVGRDKPVPVHLGSVIVDGLYDLVEMVAAGEAAMRALLAQADGDPLRNMPGGEALRAASRDLAPAAEAKLARPVGLVPADNVVLFPIVPRPVRPTHMSGCFAFPDDAS